MHAFLGRSRHIEKETYPKAHLIETLKEERASMRFWVDRGILREKPTQKRISLRLKEERASMRFWVDRGILREKPTQKRILLRL